jgi:hypothetical protein
MFFPSPIVHLVNLLRFSVAVLLLGTCSAMDVSVDKEIAFDGKVLKWPTTLAELTKVLGPPDRVTELANRIHAWDKLGVNVYTSKAKPEAVEEICFQLAKEPFPFAPKEVWGGKVVVFGAEAAVKTANAVFEKAGFTRKGSAASYKFRKVQGGFLVIVDSVQNNLGWTRVSVSTAD